MSTLTETQWRLCVSFVCVVHHTPLDTHKRIRLLDSSVYKTHVAQLYATHYYVAL